ncbi:intracellular proteinase inhibitor [Planococcus antarcticus DSM 14505]|uniref:Intracellular proteinase inhibitor n=1 Tax=Planococcus antarcticus DSM 14505 TaxID=1185653 RepID=A0A1C7DJV0_9BACL|nr:BsuPI-related putative proteinase inhibitor [Planococcus antarcticus]ANU11869.1 intracellular proteinase inhibitor (BsuPI) [Planococcus antarcticus DSM 14505]EIM06977.1 intracellular proteinase inhibitor [Planococcus antarcticus DSM 14505]
MKNKFWLGAFVMLLIALILAACGTGQGDEAANPPEEPATVEPGTGDESSEDIVEGEMKPAIEHVNGDIYRYSLVNQTGEPHTFEFTSSQRYDFSLANDSGEEVFLFSSVSTYLQALGEETLDQGDKLSYEFEIPALELDPGTYQLTAWLTPRQGETYKVTTDHVVE